MCAVIHQVVGYVFKSEEWNYESGVWNYRDQRKRTPKAAQRYLLKKIDL